MKSLWIDLRKPKNMLSNRTFKEVKIYQAYTEENKGYQEYVDRRLYDILEKKLMELQKQGS